MYKNSSRSQKRSRRRSDDSPGREAALDAWIDHPSGREHVPTTPDEEFRHTFDKLRISAHLLQGKLEEMTSAPTWEKLAVTAIELQARWAHLSNDSPDPLPSYDDFLAVRQVYDNLVKVTKALFDPQAAVIVALIELKELREKYGECKPDHSQGEAEQRVEALLTTCEQIKATELGLGHLIYDEPAFDAHCDRYYDEIESSE